MAAFRALPGDEQISYTQFSQGWAARGEYERARSERLRSVVERLRGAIRDIHDDSVRTAYRHHISNRWILSLSEEVWSELRHLSVATDDTIVAEAALAEPAAPDGGQR